MTRRLRTTAVISPTTVGSELQRHRGTAGRRCSPTRVGRAVLQRRRRASMRHRRRRPHRSDVSRPASISDFDLRPLVDDGVDRQPHHTDEGDGERTARHSPAARRRRQAAVPATNRRPGRRTHVNSRPRTTGQDDGARGRRCRRRRRAPATTMAITAPGDAAEAVEPQRWLPAAHRREASAGPRSGRGTRSTSTVSAADPGGRQIGKSDCRAAQIRSGATARRSASAAEDLRLLRLRTPPR